MTIRLISAMMPEASKSNVHGYIHGSCDLAILNTGGVEELQVNK
jgi:hypothetical protein